MPRPIRSIKRRSTIPSGAPEQLARHFATAGQFYPADEAAQLATFKPMPEDWTAVASLVRRQVTPRVFELLAAEFGEGGQCRPFPHWPREALAALWAEVET